MSEQALRDLLDHATGASGRTTEHYWPTVEGQVGSGVFKPQEGANRLRFVAGPLPHSEMYQGERRFKWLCYVLDRADKQVKPWHK